MRILFQLFQLAVAVGFFFLLYKWNKTRTSRALKKYYAKKRREFSWLDNFIKQNGDPSESRAGDDSYKNVIFAVLVFLVLVIINFIFGKESIVNTLVYLAISAGVCIIMGIKTAVNPGKYYDLDIQDLTLECPSCHCPHSWGITAKEVIVENEATIVETTKRDGYNDETEEVATVYGVKTLIDFICLNCGHTEHNEYHSQHKNSRPSDEGMNTYNPPKFAVHVQVNTTTGSKFTGNAKMTLRDGSIYEGEIVNGKPNGKGKKTFSDGRMYEGDFVNGKEHGKGKYTYLKGFVYEGNFAKGERNGKGILIQSDGKVVKVVQEGNWKNDDFVG